MENREYPVWFKKEERDALDVIRDFLRDGGYPVVALVIEEDAYFVQAEVEEVTDELRDAAFAFNDGHHSMMFDFVEEANIAKGENFSV